MRLGSATVLVAAVFSGLVESQVLTDKYLFNGGNWPWGLAMNNIQGPASTITKLPSGQVPKSCLEAAVNQGRCDRYKVEVFDITYADCATPWIVCRCTTVPSTYSIDVIAKKIGQLPVGARSWIRQVHVWDTTTGGGGFSSGNDITVFGSWPDSTILFHEVSHNLDAWYASGVTKAPAGWYSASQTWRDIANSDSCVPTAYAQSSWAEAFAEVASQAFYEENIAPVPIGTTCMANMLTSTRSILRGAINRQQNPRCTYRFTPATIMCAGPTARANGWCNGLLDLGQIPNKRDVNDTIIDDFSSEHILNHTEQEIRAIDRRAMPLLTIKGRDVRFDRDSPAYYPTAEQAKAKNTRDVRLDRDSPAYYPTVEQSKEMNAGAASRSPISAVEKRQNSFPTLFLCEHGNYAGRCTNLPAPIGICHTIIGENQDWASSARAQSGYSCQLYTQHRCLTANLAATVTSTGIL